MTHLHSVYFAIQALHNNQILYEKMNKPPDVVYYYFAVYSVSIGIVSIIMLLQLLTVVV